MNTCPNCGKISGLHSSILQGCMCQYSMQIMKEGKDFTISKPWVGLTDEEIETIYAKCNVWNKFEYERMLEAKLKAKNGFPKTEKNT
jgi:hypothetical protein